MEVSAHVCAADLRDAQRPARDLELAPLLGVWHATDRANPGVVVDAPEWSEVDGRAFAAPGGSPAIAFLAGNGRVLLAAYLNKRLLVVDCYTDNHFRRDHFYPA